MINNKLNKDLESFKRWTKEQKEYIISHSYFEKIKDYLIKEYGGEILKEPIFHNEYCYNDSKTENYCSKLYTCIDNGHHEFKDRIIFFIEYNYSINEQGIIHEGFEVYRKSDSVYLQGSSEEIEFPIVFRD